MFSAFPAARLHLTHGEGKADSDGAVESQSMDGDKAGSAHVPLTSFSSFQGSPAVAEGSGPVVAEISWAGSSSSDF